MSPAVNATSAGRQDRAFRVLLANEPRSYRESIAAVLRQLRPEVEVQVVEAQDIDASVLEYAPDLIVCSRVTRLVEDRVPNWVELYPGHGTRSFARIEGERTEYPEIQLSDMLAIVDRASRMAQLD